MKKRNIFFGLLLIICVLLFPGCTTTQGTIDVSIQKQSEIDGPGLPDTEKPTEGKDTASIKEVPMIIADLDNRKSLGGDVAIDDLTIIKRQTRAADLIDTVFVTATGHNDNYKIIRSMKLSYGLYNEGWILDSVDDFPDGENRTEPLKGPDSSVIDKYFENYNLEHSNFPTSDPPYSSWQLEDEDVNYSSGEATVYVSATRELPLWETTERLTFQYNFDEAVCNWVMTALTEHNITLDFTNLCSQEFYGYDELWNPGSWANLYVDYIDYNNRLISITGNYYRESVNYGQKGDLKEFSGVYSFSLYDDTKWNSIIFVDLGTSLGTINSMEITIYPDAIWIGGYNKFCLFDASP